MDERRRQNQKDIDLLIKAALLENNEKLVEKFNSAIEHSADKITSAVAERTDSFVSEISNLASRIGKAEERVMNQDEHIARQDDKLKYLWAKVIALIAAAATVGTFLGILVEGLLLKN